MDPEKLADYQSSYDRIAEEYTTRIADEPKDKPLDRLLLDEFAARVNGAGRVCDLGCGPGHVARYLHDRGVDIFGLDLSPGMLEQARKLNPNIEFRQGNMLALDAEDGAWAAIVAFYSIVHIPRADVPQALREMQRVLKPGGFLSSPFIWVTKSFTKKTAGATKSRLILSYSAGKRSSAISLRPALPSKTLSSGIPIRRKSSIKAAEPTSWQRSPRQNKGIGVNTSRPQNV
jgi:ubiquinone/menaquinone biosynthesis C-methylase UbiE